MNMDYLIDILAFILPIIAGVLLVTSIIVYAKFRRRFPVKTNCWFCNKNTKVPYEIQNSWYCPSCEQYNGFTKDGDYNIDISAHFTSNSPNTSSQRLQENNTVNGKSNGLCDACNNNQAIKVQLLADFEPSDERKFNEEIQQFKKRLEQTYCLCTRCEKVLSRTLAKHTSWLLGLKLSHLRSKGLSLLNPTFPNQISIKYVSFVNCILFVVATIQLMVSLFHSDLSQVFPFFFNSDNIFYYFDLNSYLRDFNTIVHNNTLLQMIIFDDSSEMHHSFSSLRIHNSICSQFIYLSLACIGILLQLSLFAWHIERKQINIIKIILWLALHFLNGPYFLRYTKLKVFLQISLSVSILIIMSLKEKVPPTLSFKKKKKSQFKDAVFSEVNNGNLFLSNDLPEKFEFNTNTKTSEYTDRSLSDLENSNHVVKKKQHKYSDLQVNVNRFKQNPVFGGKPEVFNPLKRICDIKHLNNTSNNYEKNNITISHISDKTIDFSLKHLNALDIGTKKTSHSSKHFCCQEYNGYKSANIFKISSVSPVIGYTKPLLSPPRLRNVSQSSWVAGGYWKVSECQQNEQGHVFVSRSSSQTSGIGSIISEQTVNHNFYVPINAKSNSVDEDDSSSLSNFRSIVKDTASQIPIQAVYPVLQNELTSSNKKEETFHVNPSVSSNIPSNKNDEVLHNSLILNYDRKSKSESPKYRDVSVRHLNSGMSVSSLKGEYSFNSLKKIDSCSGIEKGMLLKKWNSGLTNNKKD